MVQNYIIKGIKIVLFVILAIFVVGYIFMHLWNWLMPDIFGLTEISWHQAIGLLVLSKIIFGFGKNGKKCCGNKVKNHFTNGNWREKMKAKYANMSDEEKEKMKKKCGTWLNPDDDCC